MHNAATSLDSFFFFLGCKIHFEDDFIIFMEANYRFILIKKILICFFSILKTVQILLIYLEILTNRNGLQLFLKLLCCINNA